MAKSNLLTLISKHFRIKGSGRYLKTVEHDSLVIDTEKDEFYWNSKNIRGNAFDWLTKVENLTCESARKILNFNFNAVTENEQEEVLPDSLDDSLVEYFFELGKTERSYWYKRGFDDNIINFFKLGYYNGWYTIPIYVNNELKNIVLRRDYPEKRMKALVKGVGALPFNFDIIKNFDEIYYLEGPTDAISFVQHGLPAISTTCGTHCWKPEWIKYFTHIKLIYILFDNDNAGREGAKYIAEKIGIYKCKIYCFNGFKEKYDGNDFFVDGHTVRELKELLDKEARYAFEV